MLSNLQKLFLIACCFSAFGCGKNIFNKEMYSKSTSAATTAGQFFIGYWKSEKILIESSGEIDQNIFLQDELSMSSTQKSDFDAQLGKYDCAEVKDLTEAQKIEAEVYLYVHSTQYYMLANLLYTTADGSVLRCTGALGQGEYTSDSHDYLYLEDINIGIHASSKKTGSFVLEFLR